MKISIKKRGISLMIGYVILVSIALVMTSIVFAILKGYVPFNKPECPDNVYIFVKDTEYDCLDSLNLTLKNKGNFNVAGYFIRASNISDEELAILDLTQYLDASQSSGAVKLMPLGVKFQLTGENTFAPDSEVKHVFSSVPFGRLYSVEIIPFRYEEDGSKITLVGCPDGAIKTPLEC
jgi:hypothetical protein